MGESTAAAGLVSVADVELNEEVAGLVAAALADVLILLTAHDLGFSGASGWIHAAVSASFVLVWAVSLLVGRPRQLRAFRDALPVDDASLLPSSEVSRRHLRRARCRSGVGTLVVMLFLTYAGRMTALALAFQAVLAVSLLHTWRTAVRWERREGVRLWKPPRSSMSADEWRKAPYRVTTSLAG